MTGSSAPRSLAVALLLLASGDVFAAKGRLGFGVAADTSGVFSPVLNDVKVASVKPGSPAAAAGLRVGDRIVDIDGSKIRGAAAHPMAARLQNVEVGARIRLGVERAGQRSQIQIVAAPAP